MRTLRNIRARRGLYVFMGLICFALCPPRNGRCTIFYVTPKSATERQIQTAIDAATNGDTIVVGDGTYNENLVFKGKLISVVSEKGPSKCIITGVDQNGAVVNFSAGENKEALFSGFTVTQGEDGGIYCHSSSPNIANCIITANKNGGIYLYNAAPTITNCTVNANMNYGVYCAYAPTPGSVIKDCTITGNNGSGVYAIHSTLRVENCSLTSNTALGFGGGIYVYNAIPDILKCTIKANTASDLGGGLYLSASTPTIKDCVISGNTTTGEAAGGGVYFDNCGTSSRMSNCTIDGNTDGGIYLNVSSPTIENCTISNNTAVNGGGVYCYASSPDLSDSLIKKNTATQNGGGIYGNYFSSPTLRSCRILENTAVYGGGISLNASSSPPEIEKCVIRLNEGGGIHCRAASDPIISDCSIEENTVTEPDLQSGGITIQSASPTVRLTTIVGNSPGGIYLYYSKAVITTSTLLKNKGGESSGISCYYSSPEIKRCLINENSGGNTGAIHCTNYSSPTIVNCLITKNEGILDGGIHASFSSNPIITNCTVAMNIGGDGETLDGMSGALYVHLSAPQVLNTIFWENTPNEINNYSGVPEVSYSNIKGGYKGDGNIDKDPMFINAPIGDFHIDAASPCIDAGVAVSGPGGEEGRVPDMDLEGRIRPQTAGNDLGAYEIKPSIMTMLSRVIDKEHAPVRLGDVIRGGDYMEVTANFPTYSVPAKTGATGMVDFYVALALPDGTFQFADQNDKMVSKIVPFRINTATAQNVTIVDKFNTCNDPLVPPLDSGVYTIYWLIVPTNGGVFDTVDWTMGFLESGGYTVTVNCP